MGACCTSTKNDGVSEKKPEGEGEAGVIKNNAIKEINEKGLFIF